MPKKKKKKNGWTFGLCMISDEDSTQKMRGVGSIHCRIVLRQKDISGEDW